MLGRLILRIEHALSALAAAALIVMMAIVAIDVALRYLFNQPLAFVHEVVSLYLLAMVFYFALPSTTRLRGHVSVDVLRDRMGATCRRLSEALGALLGLVMFGAIGWLGLLRAIDSYHGEGRLIGVIAWPVWTAEAIVPVGCAVLFLRFAIHAAGHLASAITGRELIPEPPSDTQLEGLE